MRQGVYAAVGVVGARRGGFRRPGVLPPLGSAIYVGTVGVMLLVLLVGDRLPRGSQRWLDIGFFRFQPSEFGKLLLVLFLAGFLADRGKRLGETRTTVDGDRARRRPDRCWCSCSRTSARAMVYAAALAAVLFVAGTRWLAPRCCSGSARVVLALAVLWVAAGGRRPRAQAVPGAAPDPLHAPDQDPAGATYNVRQSINAVGAGGVNGRGEAGATQTNLNFLPEHATDFVFASLAEQRGFVGVSVLLLLYLLVVWRGLKVIAIARDAFSAIVAGGIVFALLFQVFVNVGHEDRDGPGDRHPAPVRERRRLGADREPARNRRPAGDPRARRGPSARPYR